jgi:hypothetical protein
MKTKMKVIRVISELFFSAKVSEVCKSLALECPVAKSKERLEGLLSDSPDAIVIVDLGLSGGAGPTLAGIAVNTLGHERVFAFYSHVAEELLSAARQAGVQNTFTRSSFFEKLPEILSSYRDSESASVSAKL